MPQKKIIDHPKLNNSYNPYQLLIESILEYGIFLLDLNGKIVLSGPGVENVLGYTAEELAGKNFEMLYEKGNQADSASFCLKKAKVSGKCEEEVWMKRKNGTLFWASCTFSSVYDKEKNVTGYSVLIKDFSEKKVKEEALKKSEEKTKLLIEGVKDYAIYMIDPDGKIVSWNEGARNLNGYSEQEIIGKNISIFYTPEAIGEDYPQYEIKQAKKRGRFENEGIRIRKNGTSFFANEIITPIYNKENKLIGYSKITRDLTEIKEAEESLRKSEEKYRLLVEGVGDYAIFMLSPKGFIESWNEGAKRFKGYSEKEAIGKHFSIFYTKEARESGYPDFELEQARKKGRFEDEGLRVRKDGSTFYANVVITAIFNSKKELIGFSKITRDMTEIKETEELLRRSEEKHRLLIEAVKDYAIYMLDPDGHVASWNEGAKRLNGYTEREITGRHFSIFYPVDKRKSGYPDYELEQARKKGRFEDDGLRVRKDGSTFYANVIITALYNSEKKLIGFSKIIRDLSERKQAEENLTHLNSELEKRVKERTEELSSTVLQLKKINMDLDNFIYTASHDLKAPVSNIEGLMNTLQETLLDNGMINEEISGFLDMINRSVKKFQSTIKDLASVNESQRTDRADLVIINFSEAIEDVMSSIDHLIKESKARITIEVEDTTALKFSRNHIRSIIYNLLTNALKYRSSERPLLIDIKSYTKDNFYIIEVSDNGLGIKEENKEKIFQMFKRLHDHVEGSGIGLYIVRRIVDNSGGRVEVISEVNKGTTFRVFLPNNNNLLSPHQG
jgi:PAS domain S-box-containing protein